LEGNKAIALANEVFGFNGWSSSLGQVQIDYVSWIAAKVKTWF
jgi:recombination DNA repair RAD52 pathway protein